MTEVKEADLIAEGLRSYPKAFVALNEFARSVISEIREAAGQELESLSKAMQLDLKQDEIGDFVRPNRLATANPRDACLGVRVDRIGRSGWGVYFYLWWSKNTPRLSASIWLRDAAVADSLMSAMSAAERVESTARTELYGEHEIFVSRELSPESPEKLTEFMQDVIQGFSDLWTKVGGLERFLKNVENP